MSGLLDTHIFLWFIAGDGRLSQTARNLILADETTVYLSIVSLWEIAIKHSVGKLNLAKPFADLMPEQLAENAITVLPIAMEDLNTVVQLPLFHRDPFDRLLIAQAMNRALPLVSNDAYFGQYPVTILW